MGTSVMRFRGPSCLLPFPPPPPPPKLFPPPQPLPPPLLCTLGGLSSAAKAMGGALASCHDFRLVEGGSKESPFKAMQASAPTPPASAKTKHVTSVPAAGMLPGGTTSWSRRVTSLQPPAKSGCGTGFWSCTMPWEPSQSLTTPLTLPEVRRWRPSAWSSRMGSARAPAGILPPLPPPLAGACSEGPDSTLQLMAPNPEEST
mmetsp:Transcript_72520/g.216376  ORF Transcript_72520/g.216376 Transcript_72520/m.216376 type:complete len:202 (+) Transcript_72520:312-917(+)